MVSYHTKVYIHKLSIEQIFKHILSIKRQKSKKILTLNV